MRFEKLPNICENVDGISERILHKDGSSYFAIMILTRLAGLALQIVGGSLIIGGLTRLLIVYSTLAVVAFGFGLGLFWLGRQAIK